MLNLNIHFIVLIKPGDYCGAKLSSIHIRSVSYGISLNIIRVFEMRAFLSFVYSTPDIEENQLVK